MEERFEKPEINENKKALVNKLFTFMYYSGKVTKNEMFAFLGWSNKKDRQLRDLISVIAKRRPIISTSDKRGYKVAKDLSDLEEVKHEYNEIKSRVAELEKRLAPLERFMQKCERVENENQF